VVKRARLKIESLVVRGFESLPPHLYLSLKYLPGEATALSRFVVVIPFSACWAYVVNQTFKITQNPQYMPQAPILQLMHPELSPATQELAHDLIPGSPALYQILTNLLYTDTIRVSSQVGWYATRRDQHPSWYTYHHTTQAQHVLKKQGLVRLSRDDKDRYVQLTRTDNLEERLEQVPVHQVVAHLPQDYVYFNKRGIDRAIADSNLHCNDMFSDEIRQSPALLNELNEMYDDIQISFSENAPFIIYDGQRFGEVASQQGNNILAEMMPRNVILTRSFTTDGRGRFHVRGTSYQQLPVDLRTLLTIDNEPVSELDFSGMVVQCAYALIGEQNPHVDDPYAPVLDILGLDVQNTTQREAVKHCFQVALSLTKGVRLNKSLRKRTIKRASELLDNDTNIGGVFDAINKAHPLLNDYLQNPDGGQLMFIESRVTRNVLENSLRQNIPILPLHDGFIAPQQHTQAVQDMMHEAFAIVSNDAPISIKVESIAMHS